jgi:hypothetical protein
MVEGETLNQLIERLQQLHLEQGRILEALENIAAEAPTDDSNEGERTSTPTTAPVATVVTEVPVAAPAPTIHNIDVFHIGQRVYITNRISHVLVRRATEADRTAIVTHFTASRVAIRTINGYHTHRHPKNLRPL